MIRGWSTCARARTCSQRCATRIPTRSCCIFGEALLRRRLGDPNATLTVALEGVRRFPQDWKVQTAAANAYRSAGRPQDAEPHARQALAIDPKDNSPLFDLGWAYLDQQQYDRATHVFHELLSREPDYDDAKPSFHYARFRGYNTPEVPGALGRYGLDLMSYGQVGVGTFTVTRWSPGTLGHGGHLLCCRFGCRRLHRGFASSAAGLGALPRGARRPSRLRSALLASRPILDSRCCVLARLLPDLSRRRRAGRVCSHPPELTLRSCLTCS
jgi:tetratricopeptide (TPR) repeat protein